MKFRHEWKYEINYSDLITLRMRLPAIMQRDCHTINNKYEIRSLYFDTPKDDALKEKINGVNKREKFRIRYYNNDLSFISLEKKTKINGLCAKDSCPLTKEETQKIVNGDIDWMLHTDRHLCKELYIKIKTQGLMPKTIVDYTREPFVYKPGNVRVTIDYNIRTGVFQTDFLNSQAITIPAGDHPMILEVKWDEYLPDIIKDIIYLPGRRVNAYSKYAQCRIYD